MRRQTNNPLSFLLALLCHSPFVSFWRPYPLLGYQVTVSLSLLGGDIRESRDRGSSSLALHGRENPRNTVPGYPEPVWTLWRGGKSVAPHSSCVQPEPVSSDGATVPLKIGKFLAQHNSLATSHDPIQPPSQFLGHSRNWWPTPHKVGHFSSSQGPDRLPPPPYSLLSNGYRRLQPQR